MSIDAKQTWPRRQLLIAQRLRQRRGDLGLTQIQVVARLTRFGLRTTNRTLSSLEHGAGLEVAKLPALADALECTITYLIGLTDDPHRWEPDQRRDERDPMPHAADAERSTVAGSHALVVGSWILGAEVPDRGSRLGLDRTDAGS